MERIEALLPQKNPRTFTVLIELAWEEGYIADVAELPGCYTQGETKEEVLKNIREAILLYLEELEESGEDLVFPAVKLVVTI